MLTRIAEDFGFTIATFQHVLEGYKVAERIAEHGAGASTFSDWWQYKYEVIDAIPYNGTLMAKNDVLVSFNSDDDELFPDILPAKPSSLPAKSSSLPAKPSCLPAKTRSFDEIIKIPGLAG